MNSEAPSATPLDPVEEAIFNAASALADPPTRVAFLNRACGSDEAFRSCIEVLLQAHDRANQFFGDDPLDLVKRVEPPANSASRAPDEPPGSVIGRYKLLEKIGEGGCGVVYMAEQEEPVRRKVALKIIKPGMDSRQVIARFEAERQALALMDHPNIAKIFDGGVTGEQSRAGVPPAPAAQRPGESASRDCGTLGRRDACPTFARPYFVMELVRGIRITDYCEQHNLSTRTRLDLFIQVCSAIQHAHQKGVIHRDLKPSNILVTENDGVPVPKVIDFGIAKATEQKLTDKTLFTQFAAFIGTPAYMSPEQAALTSVDIDTRSDIYSLGVLLYELLTGTTPFDAQELLKAGFDEMRRVIRETEPEKPSTRLATRMQGRKGEKEKRGEGAEAGGAPSGSKSPLPLFPSAPLPATPALNPQLKPLSTDLDWIVMKCLEKDRSRRYETANGLAADIQRHLSNEPVTARPPTAAYRLQKLIRRNKLAFAAVTAVSFTLLAGIAVSSWQAVRATRAEQAARQQAALAKQQSEIAQAVKEFLTENLLGGGMNVFGSPETDAISPETTRALLERVALKLEGKFTNQPLIEAEIRRAIVRASAGMNDFTNVVAQNERLLELRRPLLGPQHSDTLEAMASLAYAKYQIGQRQEARKLLAEALAIVRSSTNEPSMGAGYVLARQGTLLQFDSRPAEALPYVKEALAVFTQIIAPKDPQRMLIPSTKGRLAHVMEQVGQWEEAERLWREVIQQVQREQGPDHPMAFQAQFALGRLLLERQRVEEGHSLVERAAFFNQIRLGTNHPITLDVQYWLGQAYEQKGDVDAAAALYADIFPRLMNHWPHSSAVFCCREMASFFVRHRRYEEARSAYGAISAAWGDKPAETWSDFEDLIPIIAGARGWSAAAEFCRAHRDLFATSLSVWRLKATALFYAGDREGYRYAAGKALSLAATTNSLEDQRTILTIAVLGWSALSPEQAKQCEALLPSLEKELSAPPTNRHGRIHRTIGALQLRLDRTSEAMGHLEQALVSLSGIERARVLVLQALCFQRLGRLEEARLALAEADAIMKSSLPGPLPKYEGFLEHWQLYELMLFREAQALLAGAEPKP